MSNPKAGQRALAWAVLVLGMVFNLAGIVAVFAAIWLRGHGTIVGNFGGSALVCFILGIIFTVVGAVGVDL
jgi:hypothetical protein